MNQYFFSIKSYDDILKAVGNIIKTSQEWEKDFKTLAEYLHVNMPKEKLNKASLNKLNKKLDAENKIEKSKYLLFERIIDLRNYINHEFFLVSEEKQIEEIEKELNDIQFLFPLSLTFDIIQYLSFQDTYIHVASLLFLFVLLIQY